MKWINKILDIINSFPMRWKITFMGFIVVSISGYYFLDRILDYNEAVNLDKPKREIVKTIRLDSLTIQKAR